MFLLFIYFYLCRTFGTFSEWLHGGCMWGARVDADGHHQTEAGTRREERESDSG